jgi:glycine/D-amino acid oxidase-like deaminating enzyme
MTRSPDAVVVGAGIVGAACALALTREGMRVLVLDSGFAASGATGAGMGHIVVMDDSPAQFALTAYSLELWRGLVGELPRSCEYQSCGTLWLAASGEELDLAREKAGAYVAGGVAAEILDGPTLAAAEPHLRPDLPGAMRVPGDGVVYAPAVTRHLLTQAQAHGTEVWEGFRVERLKGGWVEGHGERVACGLIVNAAGSSAPDLTPGLPIVPRKGHLVITERLDHFCRHQLVELGYLQSAHTMNSESIAFNVQPRATGQALIGSSRELVGWDGAINPALLGRMVGRAVSFMPSLADQTALRSWTGFRPATPDKLPLVGRSPQDPGVWVAAGHEGLGITTSLGTAQILADLITGRPTAIPAAPFDPARSFVEHV